MSERRWERGTEREKWWDGYRESSCRGDETFPQSHPCPIKWTHTHTHWMLSLLNGPLFFHTHTDTVYEGGGCRFEVSLQLRGLTPQVSPWLFTQSRCNSVGKRRFQGHYKARPSTGGISVTSFPFCFWPVCDRVRLRLKSRVPSTCQSTHTKYTHYIYTLTK